MSPNFNSNHSSFSQTLAYMAWGFRDARMLQVAVKLRLFTVLEQAPQSSNQLATDMACDPDMTERLLIALATMGLVAHDQGVWRNQLAATLYLVENSPHYMGAVIEIAAHEWEHYHHLEQIVQHGRRGAESLFAIEESDATALWIKVLEALGSAGWGERLARYAPLTARRTLLDVGGAPGTLTVAMLTRFPALTITLLDSVECIEESKRYLAALKLDKKVKLKGAAWRDNPFGRNTYEAILLSQLISEDEHGVMKQLVKAFEALKSNGIVIIPVFLIDSDLNGGYEGAHRNLIASACTIEQLTAMLEEAGFERVTLLYRSAVSGDIVTATKPDDSEPVRPLQAAEQMSPGEEIYSLANEPDEDVFLLTHRRAWSGVERLN